MFIEVRIEENGVAGIPPWILHQIILMVILCRPKPSIRVERRDDGVLPIF